MNISVSMSSRFLKLKQMGLYINKHHIVEVVHYCTTPGTNKFKVYLSYPNFSGFYAGFFGFISTDQNKYEICESKTPEDYQVIYKYVKHDIEND